MLMRHVYLNYFDTRIYVLIALYHNMSNNLESLLIIISNIYILCFFFLILQIMCLHSFQCFAIVYRYCKTIFIKISLCICYRWRPNVALSKILTLHFSVAYNITGIITIGDETDALWMRSYMLKYTVDGRIWMDHLNTDGSQLVGFCKNK